MRFYFLTQALVDNFTHLGFHKAAANQAYRFYLLGHTSNLSIINPALIAVALRRVAGIVLRILTRRHRLCFITDKLPAYASGKKLFFNQQYCLDYWVPGTLSNRRYSWLYAQKNHRVYLRRKKRRVPAVILILGLIQSKTYDIYKETRSRSLVCIPLLDTDTDPSPYSYFIPTNTKSIMAIHFFLDFFSQLCGYSRLLIKKRFYNHVFKEKKI